MSLFFCASQMSKTTAAEQAIRERIQAQGRITFAEFMRTALYHPVDGYYTSEKPFGAAGDYYTSPAAHPAFGALLAVQLYGMWRAMGKPPDFTVVEMGAGNGMLADDILACAARLPDGFTDSARYIAIDRYAPAAGNSAIEWLRSTDLPLRGVVGCFISNEFVDAFPVHRFRIVDGEPQEIYVALDPAGEFTEVADSPSTPLLSERIQELDFSLADGHCGEVNLHINAWLNEVSRALVRGFVMTIDYGYEATELYSERRKFGTLQTYYRHTDGSSPYQRIGRQDMTAHADFSLLQSAGQSVGLDTLAYMTQAELLHTLGIGDMARRLRTAPIAHHDRAANMAGLRELANPDGLGNFKALIQQKETGVAAYAELAADKSMLEGLSPPLLSDRHMPLMQGRYPHTTWETPALWGISDEVTGSSTHPS